MKAVIDTGTMITFSSTCLMNVFRAFVKYNNIELIVSNDVANESVWRPIKNKRFSLNAARIKYAFSEKVVKVVPSTTEGEKYEDKILHLANNSFYTKSGPITLLQRGEAEALALAKIYGAKALFIDERTTRSLIENPLRLKKVLEKRQAQEIRMNETNLAAFREMFPDLKMFRSVDIVALAFEQDLFDHELNHSIVELEAALWATKFSGCAVSEIEINDYLSSYRRNKKQFN
jgi:hypothetical protein